MQKQGNKAGDLTGSAPVPPASGFAGKSRDFWNSIGIGMQPMRRAFPAEKPEVEGLSDPDLKSIALTFNSKKMSGKSLEFILNNYEKLNVGDYHILLDGALQCVDWNVRDKALRHAAEAGDNYSWGIVEYLPGQKPKMVEGGDMGEKLEGAMLERVCKLQMRGMIDARIEEGKLCLRQLKGTAIDIVKGLYGICTFTVFAFGALFVSAGGMAIGASPHIPYLGPILVGIGVACLGFGGHIVSRIAKFRKDEKDRAALFSEFREGAKNA